jgi:hypothetical protein
VTEKKKDEKKKDLPTVSVPYLVTREDASDMFSVPLGTINRWHKEGKLKIAGRLHSRGPSGQWLFWEEEIRKLTIAEAAAKPNRHKFPSHSQVITELAETKNEVKALRDQVAALVAAKNQGTAAK